MRKRIGSLLLALILAANLSAWAAAETVSPSLILPPRPPQTIPSLRFRAPLLSCTMGFGGLTSAMPRRALPRETEPDLPGTPIRMDVLGRSPSMQMEPGHTEWTMTAAP